MNLPDADNLVTRAGRPRRRLRAISLLPAAATLGNLLCGFLAVRCCLLAMRADYGGDAFTLSPRWETLFGTHITCGAYLVILAMIFDALDGRLARLTRRTSEFGAQLDSIADIVSFGIAPAALFITLLLRPAVNGAATPDISQLQARFGLICALVYVSCAAMRLARYNAENVKGELAQRQFSGLPSPGAAGLVVALLALHEHLRTEGFALWGVNWASVSRWGIAVTAFVVAMLMISRLDYIHVFNVYVRRKQPPTHLVWVLVILAVGWYSFELLLVALAAMYVLSGVVLGFTRRRTDPAADPAADQATEHAAEHTPDDTRDTVQP